MINSQNTLRAILAIYLVFSTSVVVVTFWNSYVRDEFFDAGAHYVSKIRVMESLHLGDSITAAGGNWGWKLWGDPFSSRNVAVPGLRVNQIIGQLSQAIRYKPNTIVILAGTNDVLNDRFNLAETVSDYGRLMSDASNVGAPCLIAIAVPYTAFPLANSRVGAVNKLFQVLARENGAHWLDLNDDIAPARVLLERFTFDGVHFTAEAYALWSRKLRAEIDQQCA